VGIDPSANVLENPLLDEREQTGIEGYRAREPFDLVTLRMVVEHVPDPQACVAAIAQNARPGGVVVVYTPHKYSLLSIASALVPQRAHHALKSRLWGTEERDTFPAFYRMNTPGMLRRLFEAGGFRTLAMWLLDDATVFHSRPRLGPAELAFWSLTRRLRLPYPERNILAVFERA
ncbi:MAG TPA: methyltransferase domain-containing protein, partial [Pirellulaceae bacterium]|nr:methyltransferase domain-containing protein [Pirellulaceae bacterium]